MVASNAALMCGAWFLLPPAAKAWLFALHGPLAFPVVLASWMVADTPATNVLADQDASTEALAGADRCRRWLRVRSVSLGLVVAVPCIAATLLLGVLLGHWAQVVLTCMAVLLAPLGVLPLAAWLGLILPYRQQPISWRWRQRRLWRTHLRWGLLVLAPYVLVPVLTAMLVLPAFAVERAVAGRTLDLSAVQVLVVGSTLTATMLAAGRAGSGMAARIADRRRTSLLGFVTDQQVG